MKKIRLNMFHRMLLLFLMIGTIPLAILGTSYYAFSNNLLKNEIIHQTQNSLTNIGESMDLLIDEYDQILSVLSKDDEVRKVVSQDSVLDNLDQIIYQKMYFLLATKKNEASIYILNSNGTISLTTHALPQVYDINKYRNWGIFRKANELDNSSAIYTHKYTNSTGDTVTLSLARAVRDESGSVTGYVIIDIYESHILEMINSNTGSLAMDAAVVDKYFYVVGSARNPYMEGNVYPVPYENIINEKKTGYIIADVNGKNSLIAFRTSRNRQLITLGIISMDIVAKNSYFIRIVTFISCGISIVICFIFALILADNMTRPVRKIVNCMKKVEDGDLSVRVDLKRQDEIGILGKHFNIMIARIKDLLDNVIEKQKRIRISEIKALQAQINPHFLYNTLDSIKWIAKLNHVDEISVIVTHLAKLLRYSIKCDSEFSTVSESISIIECYIGIQKVRYSDKFDVSINIDQDIYDCIIPKLILQPLVENAIVHGLENKLENGILSVTGKKDKDGIVFEIFDNGSGIDSENLRKINSGEPVDSCTSSGIGIENVNKRIKLHYGNTFGLYVESAVNYGTKVIIRMPFSIGGELSHD